MHAILASIYHEVGLKAFIASPRDVKVLCLQRFVRLGAYGASTLVLVLYLVELGNSVSRAGLFMTLTLAGDVIVSLILTLVADKLGRRLLLAFGSLLMSVSGIAFALSGNFWVLLVASIIGIISPSGNEIGPFKAIEESIISQLAPADDRSSVLAWYTLFGTAGVAVGTVVCGWVVRVLQNNHGWTPIRTYRLMYAVYAVLGMVKFSLCLMLSRVCEHVPEEQRKSNGGADATDEQRPLLADDSHQEVSTVADTVRQPTTSLLPSLSVETRWLLLKLGFLFSMDSLASGLAPPSWLIYFFHTKFGLKEGKLGSLFFFTNILSSASNLVSSSLARRLGLIQTMIFTHVPASLALLLLPFPSSLVISVALLIFRATTNSMDQAPRQAFLAAAVLPSERTSVMGIVNVIKTCSQSIGPVITGKLAGIGEFWVAFVVAGGLKLLYDALLLGMFLDYRTVEDKAKESISRANPNEREDDTHT